VASHVAVVKPQAAFFEQLGPVGMTVLAEVIAYAVRLDLIVILDGKRNDIGTTAAAYADAYLGRRGLSAWGADALTVSPYLGDDSLVPFVNVCDQRQAGVFVLVKTSNPGSGFLQDHVCDGLSMYQRVADHLEQLNLARRDRDGYGPIGAVVGATYREQLASLRKRMPSTWILIPGFGAQGGSPQDVGPGFDECGLGAIVNNSRNLIFAHSRKEYVGRYSEAKWQDAVAAATVEMNEQLRAETPMGRL
jgi:orotidine-5'-phosphate decarboxylase